MKIINEGIIFCIVLFVGSTLYKEMENQGLISQDPSEFVYDIIYPWRWFKKQ